MDGNSRGGDDTLTGADHSINLFYGDALNMQANARGGDDTLIGVDRAGNHLCARKPGGTTSNPARLPPSFGTTAMNGQPRLDLSSIGLHHLGRLGPVG